jgi:MFS family permease
MHGVGFWLVAAAYAVIMAFSAVPTPLYGLYAARDGFGSLTITVVYAVYAGGVILALFTVGHVSDWYGRRRVLIPALLIAALSSVLFLIWRDLAGLMVARFVDGIAVGATAATATAWIGELHAARRPAATPRRAEIVGAATNLGGIGAGPSSPAGGARPAERSDPPGHGDARSLRHRTWLAASRFVIPRLAPSLLREPGGVGSGWAWPLVTSERWCVS